MQAAASDSVGRPPLLVCHDLAGGYGPDAMLQGSQEHTFFRHQHWSHVDLFVYFSHVLVTLPPPAWVHAAHKHGVPVLGTLITEWDAGEGVCACLFGSDDRAAAAAAQLAAVARHYGFDGWLVNIENMLSPEHVPRLLCFLRQLTALMREQGPRCRVVWYDAATVEGELKWQDTLNHLNRPFFDACDALFVNYTWAEGTPAETAAAAGRRGADVLMGVDVFGRGTFGGGGFDCHVALRAARAAGLGAAMFAPGWAFECADGPAHYLDRQHALWASVAACWGPPRPHPAAWPLHTTFDAGCGEALWQQGRRVSGRPWYDLKQQALQPLLPRSAACACCCRGADWARPLERACGCCERVESGGAAAGAEAAVEGGRGGEAAQRGSSDVAGASGGAGRPPAAHRQCRWQLRASTQHGAAYSGGTCMHYAGQVAVGHPACFLLFSTQLSLHGHGALLARWAVRPLAPGSALGLVLLVGGPEAAGVQDARWMLRLRPHSGGGRLVIEALRSGACGADEEGESGRGQVGGAGVDGARASNEEGGGHGGRDAASVCVTWTGVEAKEGGWQVHSALVETASLRERGRQLLGVAAECVAERAAPGGSPSVQGSVQGSAHDNDARMRECGSAAVGVGGAGAEALQPFEAQLGEVLLRPNDLPPPTPPHALDLRCSGATWIAAGDGSGGAALSVTLRWGCDQRYARWNVWGQGAATAAMRVGDGEEGKCGAGQLVWLGSSCFCEFVVVSLAVPAGRGPLRLLVQGVGEEEVVQGLTECASVCIQR